MSNPYALRVNSYDRVTSMIFALLVLVAAAVIVLFVIWLSSQIFLRQEAVPVEFERIGSGEGPLLEDQPLAPPDVETTDPTVPEIADRLSAVADAVSDQAVLVEDVRPGTSSQVGIGGSGGEGVGSGDAAGKPQRWELAFPPGSTLRQYARQLDYFGIELGVLLPNNRVRYAGGFSSGSPRASEGVADEEKRYYLFWRRGPLQQADRELLSQAGIDSGKRPVLKFLPPELEQRMAQIERQHAGARAEQIRRTRFGIVPRDGGWDIIVFEQTYR